MVSVAVNRAEYSPTSCPDTEPIVTYEAVASLYTHTKRTIILRSKLTACTCFGSRRQRNLQKKWRRPTWGIEGKGSPQLFGATGRMHRLEWTTSVIHKMHIRAL